MSTVNSNGSAYAIYSSAWPSGDFTVRMWVKPSATADGSVFGTNASNPYFLLYVQTDGWYVYDGAGAFAWLNLLIEPTADTWYHIVYVREGNDHRWYIRREADTSYTLGLSYSGAWGNYPVFAWLYDSAYGGPPNSVSFKHIRLSTAVLTLGDILADSQSNVAIDDGTTLWLEWAPGENPDPATYYVDGTGNGRSGTPTGTAIEDPSDPVPGGGGGIVANEVTEITRFRASALLSAQAGSAYAAALMAIPGNFATALTPPELAAEVTRIRPRDNATQLGALMPTRALGQADGSSATEIGASLGRENTRQAPGDFAVSQSAQVTTQTERLRVAYRPFATGLAHTVRTSRQAPQDTILDTALDISLDSDTARTRFFGYSTSAAGIILAHTERLRMAAQAVVSGFAGGAPTETLATSGGTFSTTLAVSTLATSPLWRAHGVSSGFAGVVDTATQASVPRDTDSLFAAQAQSDAVLIFAHDFSTSGEAMLFAHTERVRQRTMPITSGHASTLPPESVAWRPSDYTTATGALTATERTEVIGVTPGNFANAYANAQPTTPQFYLGQVMETMYQTAPATEGWRQRTGDYAPSADALLFAHTERIRTVGRDSTTVTAALARSAIARTRAGETATMIGATSGSSAMDPAEGTTQTSASSAFATERIRMRSGVTSTLLAAQAYSEALHVRPSDYSTGAVIFVSANTERVSPIPANSLVTLGILGSTLQVVTTAKTVSSAADVDLATEQVRDLVSEYVTVMGTQQVNERTERYALRAGGYTAQVSVLPVTVTVYGAMGTGPFGTMPFGTALPTGAIAPKRLLAVAANALLVPYAGATGAPGVNNPRSPNSALNPSNWSIDAIDPQAMVRLPLRVFAVAAGQVVDGLPPATEEGFIIVFDAPLTQGAEYRLGQTPSSVNISPLMVPDRQFDALYIRCDAMPRDERDDDGSIRDIANPFLARDALQFPPALGTYQITDDGDLANDDGQASLRKRVIRRISATAGDFIHLPEYGAGIVGQVKQLRRIDTLQRMQAKIRAQVAKEPEITRCTVQVRPANGDSAVIVVAVTYWSVSNPAGETVVVPVAL